MTCLGREPQVNGRLTTSRPEADIISNAGSITGVVDHVKDLSSTGSLTRSTTVIPSLIDPALRSGGVSPSGLCFPASSDRGLTPPAEICRPPA